MILAVTMSGSHTYATDPDYAHLVAAVACQANVKYSLGRNVDQNPLVLTTSIERVPLRTSEPAT